MQSRMLENIEHTYRIQPLNAYLIKIPSYIHTHIISNFITIKDYINLSINCRYLKLTYKSQLKKHTLQQLFQSFIDDERFIVNKILSCNLTFLLIEPADENINEIESKLTLQRFKTEKLFIMAQKLKRFEMIKIIYPFFDKLNNISENKSTNDDMFKQQWTSFPINDAEREQKNLKLQEYYTSYYLQPVIDAINIDDCKSEPLNIKTEEALDLFRKKLLSEEAIAIDDMIDIEQLLIASFKAYIQYANDNYYTHYYRNKIFGARVVGFIQSLVSPELAKIYCEDLEGERFWFNTNSTSLKLTNNKNYYRATPAVKSGLGFDFFCGIKRYYDGSAINIMQRLKESHISDEINYLQKYFYQRNQQILMIPLFNVIKECNRSSIQKLISLGINVNTKFYDQTTALGHASVKGNLECIKLLIDNKADLNLANAAGDPPLLLAAYFGQVDAIRMLIEAKAEVINSSESADALYWTIVNKHHTSFDLLLEYSNLEQSYHINVAARENNSYAFKKIFERVGNTPLYRKKLLDRLKSVTYDKNRGLNIWGLFKNNETDQATLDEFKDTCTQQSAALIVEYSLEKDDTTDKMSLKNEVLSSWKRM